MPPPELRHIRARRPSIGTMARWMRSRCATTYTYTSFAHTITASETRSANVFKQEVMNAGATTHPDRKPISRKHLANCTPRSRVAQILSDPKAGRTTHRESGQQRRPHTPFTRIHAPASEQWARITHDLAGLNLRSFFEAQEIRNRVAVRGCQQALMKRKEKRTRAALAHKTISNGGIIIVTKLGALSPRRLCPRQRLHGRGIFQNLAGLSE